MKTEEEFPLNKVSEELNNDVLDYIKNINIKTEPGWTNTTKNKLMIFYSWLLDKNYMHKQSPEVKEPLSEEKVLEILNNPNILQYDEKGFVERSYFAAAAKAICALVPERGEKEAIEFLEKFYNVCKIHAPIEGQVRREELVKEYEQFKSNLNLAIDYKKQVRDLQAICEGQAKGISNLEKRLYNCSVDNSNLIGKINEIIELKNSAKTTQDLYPVLQAINRIALLTETKNSK